MTDAQTDSYDALVTLIDMAHAEIAAAITNSESDEPVDILQLCRDHVENIGWAADMAGFDRLNTVINAVSIHLADESMTLSEEQVVEIVIWLSDIKLYLESPDDEHTFNILLNPLPDEMHADVLSMLTAEEAAPESLDSSAAMDDVFEDADGDVDIDSSSILGMLASEIKEVSPQLTEIAQEIATCEDDDLLITAIDAYQELVGRVSTVSEELQLNGLVMVCQFVNANVLQVAQLAPGDRASAVEVLIGWPRVIIDHLVQPDNDELCIAVVDYLENERWPSPLPYREVRDLIEGLTKQLELSGDFEVEAREVEANPEDVSLTLSEDISTELLDAFFSESPGHAEAFSKLMEKIASGEDIQTSVEAAQRIAHTLKGSGNLVGASGIANLSHHIEDIFEYIAKHQIVPPRALSNTMQEAADTIEVMIEFLQGMAPAPDNAQRVLQDVLDWANRIDSGNLRQDDFGDLDSDSAPAADTNAPTVIVERRHENIADAAPAVMVAETVRVPLDVLDNIFRIVSETAIAIGQIQEHLNRLEDSDKMIRKNDSSLQQHRYELENLVSIRGMAARHRHKAVGDSSSGFDPLEMDEYDEFYGATHSYIEGVADSREILREVATEVSELNALFLLQQRLNKELQQVVMTTRMVPVNNITARLQRAVRQVCRATEKQAELVVTGEELLMDGDVLNKLADPLMHMLRNAVDHSIESSESRFDLGKSTKGRIHLSFKQEGNNVVVDCTDDGQGLNYDRIRETAIERGLITDQENPDHQALARMILHSGFSTSDRVTHVSGRGVGMDVVHNTIQSLNGTMEVGDSADGGTLISMRLPITLLTSHCLLAGISGNLVYAIPTISLTQILSPGTGEIGRVGDHITYQLGKDVYMVHRLVSLLGMPDDGKTDIKDATILLVQTIDGVVAVAVDQVVSSYDLVIKNLGVYIKSVRGVTGVSILGNGNVIAVLDLPTLLQARDNTAVSQGAGLNQKLAVDEIKLPSVLIVDDSLSVRNSLSQLMSDGGYRVVTARDGLEAINVIDKEKPDIVLTDLEMPRMNGLELVSYIRNTEHITGMPIVMITSRTQAKHRQQAELAGVNRYITKPFTEDEVLASIDEHLSQNS